MRSGAAGAPERLARSAVLKVLVQGTRLLSLLFVVLAARALGPAQFGKFTFAYALAALLGAAIDLGLPVVLIRNVARAPGTATAQWGTAAVLKAGLLLPAGLAYAVFPLVTHRPADTTWAVWLLGAALVLQSFVELAVSVFTGLQRLDYELAMRIVEKVVLAAVGLGGLALGGGLVWVASAFVVSGGVSTGLAVYLLHRRCGRFRRRWRPGRARALARGLGPVAGWFVLAYAATRLVPLVVALVGGDAAAGHFGAALRVVDMLQVIPVALGAAVYPALARRGAGDPRFRELVTRASELLVLVALPIALALGYGAPWLTVLVYGPAYAPAATALALVGVAAGLGFLEFSFAYVLLALDRPRRMLAVAAASCAASLAVTPALVRHAGAAGGAAALCVVEGVAVAGGLVALGPLIGPPLRGGALKAVGAAAAAAGAGFLLPAGPWRPGVALVVYGGLVLAIRPLPGGAWRRDWRGALLPGAPPGEGGGL